MNPTMQKKRNEIQEMVKNLPVKESENILSQVIFEQFENQAWMAFPEDYKWFMNELGHRVLSFNLFGIKTIASNIHVIQSVKEAKRMTDHTPLLHFLVLEYVDTPSMKHSFYYIQLNSYRVKQETLPVLYWNGESGMAEEVYPDFYEYVIARMK